MPSSAFAISLSSRLMSVAICAGVIPVPFLIAASRAFSSIWVSSDVHDFSSQTDSFFSLIQDQFEGTQRDGLGSNGCRR
jgi:hypothetical protein